MVEFDQENIFVGTSEADRINIAHRVGELLSTDDLPEADKRAAESLARILMEDALEQVRRVLSETVKYAKFLPRDIALKIAHDVDSVASPFLDVTEVFSDSDWRELMETISQGARVAVAKRPSISDELAQVIAEYEDFEVIETFLENPAAPMTEPVSTTIIENFESEIAVLDKMAVREDLLVEIAANLINKVSAAAREKLERRYDIPEFASRVAVDAETATILRMIAETAAPRLPDLVTGLKNKNWITHSFLLAATRSNLIAFLAAALSPRAAMPVSEMEKILSRADVGAVLEVFRRSRIPASMYDEFWEALVGARVRLGRAR